MDVRPSGVSFVVPLEGLEAEPMRSSVMPTATVASSWSETLERLRRYIASRIDDPEAAADLAQDVVARSLAADALDRATDLNGWLFRCRAERHHRPLPHATHPPRSR